METVKVVHVPDNKAPELFGKVMYNSNAFFNMQLDAGDTPLDEDGFHVLSEDGEPVGPNRKYFVSTQEQKACDHLMNPGIHAWLCATGENALDLIDHNPVKREI